ncbi:MAG: hypothetical protein ACI9N1_000465 [Flavobacteriales bacterium]|jgi:hypothetical protein
MSLLKFVAIFNLIAIFTSCTPTIKKSTPKIKVNSISKIEVLESYPGTKLDMKKGFKSQFITEYGKAQAIGPAKFMKPYKVIIHYENEQTDTILTNDQYFNRQETFKTEKNIIEDYIIREKKYFFDFDEVNRYKIEVDGIELLDKQRNPITGEKQVNLTELEQLKIGLILGKEPTSIEDTAFIEQLELMGFSKNKISEDKLDDLNEIFRYREVEQNSATCCKAVYRDIFIFKKESKIVGNAKICFNCDKRRIYGSNFDTRYFGQNDEYRMLEQLLNK